MGSIINISAAEYDRLVLDASNQQTVLAYFYSPTCQFCQQLGPVVEALVPGYNVTVAKINVDENSAFVQAQQVRSIPDVRLIRNGNASDRFVGALNTDQVRGFLARNEVSPTGGQRFVDLTPNNDTFAVPANSLAENPSGVRAFGGDDTITGSSGVDVVFANTGNDVLRGGDGDDALWGGTGNDNIDGQAGDDVVNGNRGNDVVLGNAGNDLVRGGQGDDSLLGGEGSDILVGDLGTDTLLGGAGRDFLVLRAVEATGQRQAAAADQIADFNPADDRVLIAADVAREQIVLTDGSVGSTPAAIVTLANGDILGVVLNQSASALGSLVTVVPSTTLFA